MNDAQELRRITVFSDLKNAELEWLADHGEFRDLDTGDAAVEEGSPADVMLAVIEGELRGRGEKKAFDGVVVAVRAGEISGMLPFSRMKTFPVTSRAIVPSRLVFFPASLFPEMLERVPVLEPRLIAALADRVRKMTRDVQHRDALMALGKLSAGLAHELNNPAAAALRSTGLLHERLHELCFGVATLAGRGVREDGFRALTGIARGAGNELAGCRLDPLSRAEHEERLAEWLEAAGVAEPWSCAETFVAAGISPDTLAPLDELVPAGARAEALNWLETAIAASALVRDVENATTRIVEMVAAITTYTNMDRSPDRTEADLHAGIDSTIAVLGHKLRDARIEVVREYAPDLPRVPAHAGELNQVWSNLLDNAIHALSSGGRIRVCTAIEQDRVRIEVCDDGPGIPPEIQHRIWEPFFTTKDVGAGSGMGLDIVRRIVVERHDGEIRVDSVPGETRFTVYLPVAAPVA